MSFRRRNVDVSARGPSGQTQNSVVASSQPPVKVPGTRPSSITGQPTISTGAPSLDSYLAGHAGLPLGTSLLIEENGNTDYAGVLLKYFAAEGVLQNNVVHVIGVDERWGRSLPGLASESANHGNEPKLDKDKMVIAWRYERLGELSQRGVNSEETKGTANSRVTSPASASDIFCHTFDLAKKLTAPELAGIQYHAAISSKAKSSLGNVVGSIAAELASTAGSHNVHRIVIPSLLSPAYYALDSCEPPDVLQFAHSIRAMLRQYPQRLACMTTLPLDLYPRTTGVIRWLEILSDGVVELTPFAHGSDEAASLSTSGAATAHEEPPQGMFMIHKLPIFHERGGGGGGGIKNMGDDLAFILSRRRFTIKPFNLPPTAAEGDAQQAKSDNSGPSKATKESVDF